MNAVGRPRTAVGIQAVVCLFLFAFGQWVGADGYRAGTPQFSPERGFYFAPIDVRLWIDTPETRLVYTMDGSEPSLAHGHMVEGTNIFLRLTNTTILRASAFKSGAQPTNHQTHTYLFPAAVANQTRPANVKPFWPGGYPADFEMDARIGFTNAGPGYRLTNALLELPSISIVMPPEDLWGPAKGIYAKSLVGAERPASFEILHPGGQLGVQEEAGVCIRGFSSGKKSLTPKHSFTVVFRRRYGTTKLEHPLFTDTAGKRFNALVLRANAVDSWANSEQDWNHSIDGELRWYRARASYVRDQWMRDAQVAQGQPAGHGRFVHLYLNGFYWGIYNLIERLDEKFAHHQFRGCGEGLRRDRRFRGQSWKS
jgi:hypothetical protein